jgi:predicted Zn-dependent protease
MIDKGKSFELINKVLAEAKADMAEAILESGRLTLTRFAESRIHQNIDTEGTNLYIRLVKDKKVSVIVTGDISEEGIQKALADGVAMLGYIPPDENFDTLPSPDGVTLEEDSIVGGTVSYSANKRAEAVARISQVCHKGNLEAAGAFRIEENSIAIGNSLGALRYYSGNNAQLSITLSGKNGESGWVIEYNPDAGKIDIDGLAKKAAMKAVTSRNPISLSDGQYTVILEPAAVGQLLILLSFMGFGVKTFYQKRSFMAGKIGQKIAGDNFTVYEDPAEPFFNALPFDYEGVARQKVPLIENGIARGVVSNSYYAKLLGEKSTGNALSPNNNYGPYPVNLVVSTGDSSIEEMIKSTGKGILITHFWYLNFLNPMRTMVTGTTRDGTFLIENGQIGAPIKNMRTNQSILEAFSNIEAIARDSIVYPQYSILMKLPAMKINNFNLVAEAEDNKC